MRVAAHFALASLSSIVFLTNQGISQNCGVSHKDFKSLQSSPQTLPGALDTQTFLAARRYVSDKGITLNFNDALHAVAGDAETFVFPITTTRNKALLNPISLGDDTAASNLKQSDTQPSSQLDRLTYNAKYTSSNIVDLQQWMIYVYRSDKPTVFYLEAAQFSGDQYAVTVLTRPDAVKMVFNYGENIFYYIPAATTQNISERTAGSDYENFVSCLNQATGAPAFNTISEALNRFCTFAENVKTMIALATVCAPCVTLIGCGPCLAAWAAYLTCTTAQIKDCFNNAVSGVQPSFSLDVNPILTIITQGQSAQFTVSATYSGGFGGPVSGFQVSGLPSGASPSFSASSISPSSNNTQLLITTSSNTPAGSYPVTISGIGGGNTRSRNITLTIMQAQGGGGSGGATQLNNGQSVTANLTGGEQRSYQISVPQGTGQMVVTMTNVQGDPDLYVKNGSQATLSSYDCRPYNGPGQSETCTFNNPVSGNYFIMVNGYSSSSSYTLTATYSGGSGTGATVPTINDINPKSVPVGTLNTFTLSGTGFQQGFSARLLVGNNPFTVDPSQTNFMSLTQVQVTLRVGAVGDPTTAFCLQVTNPGGAASNQYCGLTAQASGGGGGGTAGVLVSFIPNPVSLTPDSTCNLNGGKHFSFTLKITETQGVGVTPTTLGIDGSTSYTPDGFTQHIGSRSSNQFPLSWCRGPGMSTWTVTVRDDNGNIIFSSGTLNMNP